MESEERIEGAAANSTNLFAPEIDADNPNQADIISKSVLVSPTEEQYTALNNHLAERLLQGETIYEIGIGGEYSKYYLSYDVTGLLSEPLDSYH